MNKKQIEDSLKLQDRIKEINMVKVASEIIGDYGESSGVVCPYCGGREYPFGTGGKLVKCSYCGNVYQIPEGYSNTRIRKQMRFKNESNF